MRSAIRNVLATTAVVLLAASAFAALSPEYANFGKGPAQYFMTADELAKWKTINSDADAKAFIDLFWMRRDPTPATPVNEFKNSFDQLVKIADEKFGYRRTPGSMTDRGHVLMILGVPTDPIKQERIPGVGRGSEGLNSADDSSSSQAMPSPQVSGARQTWIYDPAKMPKPIAAIIGTAPLSFVFVDANGTGDFRLDKEGKGPNTGALLEKVAALYITQPNLTAVTQQTTTTTTKTVTQKPAGPAALTQLKTPAYQAAVDAVKAGKNELAKNAALGYGELVSPKGDYYVPLTLYIPKSAGLTADSIDTFFGVVEDANGAPVFAFEDPAKLTATHDDFFVDKTLGGNLATGKYTVIAGVAKAGQPLVVTSKPLDLTTVTADATGTSKMILSNNVYEMAEAAPVKAPFAFGKLKIVPQANLIFGPKDELSYFVELHNPGIDTATNLPKLQSKLELSGGKLTKGIAAPLSDAPALPLSGTPGPGQYAIISSIPLGEMTKPLAPGDYTLKMKLIDTVTKKTYNLEQSFVIANETSAARTSEPVPAPTQPNPQTPKRPETATGTAFLVSPNGQLVTNWHVVERARSIDVRFADQAKPFTARIVRHDANNDLAVLKIDDFNATSVGCTATPAIRSASDTHMGDQVFAIGYPLEGILGSSPKYANGVISSKTGIDDDPRVYQVTVPIQPGNSGSPLFSADGSLIGVVVSTLDAGYLYSRAQAIPQNVNFAIKADYVAALLERTTAARAAKTIAPDPDSLSKCVALVSARE